MGTAFRYPLDRAGMQAVAEGAGLDTRAEAYVSIKDRAVVLRSKCLEALRDAALTVHELAARIGETVPSTQPRVSELFKEGKVLKTTLRRKNATGKSAAVWVAV